jgi:hypothetical protein
VKYFVVSRLKAVDSDICIMNHPSADHGQVLFQSMFTEFCRNRAELK